MRGELSAAQAGTLPASWALSLSNWSWSPPHQLSYCLLEGGEAQECQTESLKEEKTNKQVAPSRETVWLMNSQQELRGEGAEVQEIHKKVVSWRYVL